MSEWTETDGWIKEQQTFPQEDGTTYQVSSLTEVGKPGQSLRCTLAGNVPTLQLAGMSGSPRSSAGCLWALGPGRKAGVVNRDPWWSWKERPPQDLAWQLWPSWPAKEPTFTQIPGADLLTHRLRFPSKCPWTAHSTNGVRGDGPGVHSHSEGPTPDQVTLISLWPLRAASEIATRTAPILQVRNLSLRGASRGLPRSMVSELQSQNLNSDCLRFPPRLAPCLPDRSCWDDNCGWLSEHPQWVHSANTHAPWLHGTRRPVGLCPAPHGYDKESEADVNLSSGSE